MTVFTLCVCVYVCGWVDAYVCVLNALLNFLLVCRHVFTCGWVHMYVLVCARGGQRLAMRVFLDYMPS